MEKAAHESRINSAVQKNAPELNVKGRFAIRIIFTAKHVEIKYKQKTAVSKIAH